MVLNKGKLNLITIIVGRGLQFVLALATLKFATTLLSPEEMGKVSLILTSTAFFAMFFINPVGMFINRRLHTWQANGSARVYFEHFWKYLGAVATVAASGLLLFDMAGWVNFGVPLVWLVVLVCGSLIFNTINQTSIPSLNMLGDTRTFVVLSVATMGASFVCAVALVWAVKPSAQYWVLGLLLGQTLLAIAGTQMLFGRLRLNCVLPMEMSELRKQHFLVLFEFAWPVVLAAGFGWVQGQSYRYILESQLGVAQLGLFVAGYGISAGMVAGFESVLTTYFQPRLYRDANKDHPKEQAEAWQRYASVVIPSLVLTVGLIIILAPELTQLFLGERFQSASSFVVWGALAEAARVLTGVYSLIAHVFMRTRWLILPAVIGAFLAITACALLIPRMGAVGAGLALVFAGFVVVAVLHVSLVSHVAGSVAKRPIFQAATAVAVLWLLMSGFRYFAGNEGWTATAEIIVMAGAAYLGLLFLLLRAHLVGKARL